MNLGGRANQYDLWPEFTALARLDDDLILVLDQRPEPHPVVVSLAPHFQSVERGSLVPLTRRDGSVIAQRRVWVFLVWKGTWPSK